MTKPLPRPYYQHPAMRGVLVLAVMISVLVSFFVRNGRVVQAGGETWLHGEWLINFSAGVTRRGFSGEAMFAIHDLLGFQVLNIVQAIQFIPVFGIVASVALVMWRLNFAPVLCLIALSPTFILFWHNVFGTHAKEILALSAFVPIILSANFGRALGLSLTVSVLVFFVSGLFYEPSFMLAPGLLIGAWMLVGQRTLSFVLFAIFIAISSLITVGFALRFPSVQDWVPMCDAIVSRGVDPSNCLKFEWSTFNAAQSLDYTAARSSQRDWFQFALVSGLSFVPLIALALYRRSETRLGMLILAQALFFLPLYWIAIDYGRWLNIQVSSITLLIFVAVSVGRFKHLLDIRLERYFYPLLAFSLAWGATPITGRIIPGFLGSFF